ncbi:hypothetical protein N8303_03110 [Gammaproteobacteria bacterium]|jgi:hypothetical protein|nr:hypothetical protein [Gammaproteobacteria bacterium]
MKINMAHLRQETSNGDFMDFAIFDARSESGSEADNLTLLNELSENARKNNFKVDQAVLVFKIDDEIRFYGSTELAKYLSKVGFPKWTHQIDIKT